MINRLKLFFRRKAYMDGLAVNMLASGIYKPASMIINYIYVPVVLNYLGIEKYGIWATILTILSWISYFDIGIGNGLRNRLTETIAYQKDRESQKLISSAYAFIAIIMTLILIIFCTAAVFADWNTIFGVKHIDENLTAVVCISVGFVSINFVVSSCKNVFYALQKASYVSLMELFIQILNLSGVLIAKWFGYKNLFVMAFIYGGSMLIVNFVFSTILYWKKKELRPKIKKINLTTGRNLTRLGMQFFLIQICALVLFTTDSIIISYLYGASNVTPYSTVNKLFHAVSSVYVAFLTPVWSAVTKAKVEQNWKYLKHLIKRLHILMIPFVVGTMLLIMIFKPLSNWWLGQELNYENSLIMLGGVYCILTIWCNTYANIANGLELMKMSMTIAFIQAGVNIPLSLLFAEKFGMNSAGVLFGTVLAMIISAIVQPIWVHKRI